MKSYSRIKEVFARGKECTRFPLKVRYLEVEDTHFQIAVAVSKRRFKRAVDRNKIKRLLKVAISESNMRANQLQSKAIILMYIGKEILPLETLKNKLNSLLDEMDQEN